MIKCAVDNKDYTMRRGFTIIELMIIISILGILAAVAVPAFMEYREAEKAKQAAKPAEKMPLIKHATQHLCVDGFMYTRVIILNDRPASYLVITLGHDGKIVRCPAEK
jgi:prepilin-type N-terminal cleavage/methylation domain-containing protein